MDIIDLISLMRGLGPISLIMARLEPGEILNLCNANSEIRAILWPIYAERAKEDLRLNIHIHLIHFRPGNIIWYRLMANKLNMIDLVLDEYHLEKNCQRLHPANRRIAYNQAKYNLTRLLLNN